MSIEGTCHCGAVRFTVDDSPKWLVSCNCSICSRLAALWFHTTVPNVRFSKPVGPTVSYVWGDRMLAFHSCLSCGCTTHYMPLDGGDRMAVNMRMVDFDVISGIRIRNFDGAATWAFLN